MWLRILQFPPIKLFLLGYPLFYCIGYSNAFQVLVKSNHVASTFAVAAMIALAMWVYDGFGRLIERREISDLAFSPGLKELGIGMVVGAGLYTVGVLVLIVLGYRRIEGMNPVVVMIPALYQACSAAFHEELLVRGALYRTVEEWLGSWISVLVSSVVFGFVHLMNPDATLTDGIFISIEAGLLLAAAYMFTRRLWLGIGFNIAWNYTQSAVSAGSYQSAFRNPACSRRSSPAPI